MSPICKKQKKIEYCLLRPKISNKQILSTYRGQNMRKPILRNAMSKKKCHALTQPNLETCILGIPPTIIQLFLNPQAFLKALPMSHPGRGSGLRNCSPQLLTVLPALTNTSHFPTFCNMGPCSQSLTQSPRESFIRPCKLFIKHESSKKTR